MDLTNCIGGLKISNFNFNGKKFLVVRYGPDENLKDETLYFTENTENTEDIVE